MQKYNDFYRFHTSCQSSWEAMLSRIDEASHSIYLEEFILLPDKIGMRFLNALYKKASEGVKVKVLLDWFGCKTPFWFDCEKPLRNKHLKDFSHPNLEIIFYNEPNKNWFFGSSNFLPRDHRKLLIIDEKILFIGGVCIYDKITNWRDTMVEMTKSHVVKTAVNLFNANYDGVLNHGSGAKIMHNRLDEYSDTDFKILAHCPNSNENQFFDYLKERIENAVHNIRLTTPYFSANGNVMKLLKAAAKRGIKVELILSKYSEYHIYVVGKHKIDELIKENIHIYYYNPSMMHLKMMIIDGKWGAIGSCNLDNLSLKHNEEIMLVSEDLEFCEALTQHFKEDRSQSSIYTMVKWLNRPLNEKIMGNLLFPMREYL